MAIANKTRWSEKWLVGGAVQTVSIKIVDGADFSEVTKMTLQPIKCEVSAPVVNKVAQLAQRLKAGLTI